MSTTIESLELEIQSSSQSAEQGLNALYNSLDKLKNITKGGVGLTSVASQMRKLNDGINKLSSQSIANLHDLTNAMGGLKNLQGVKLSSTIAKSIGEIGEASGKLNAQGVALLREIAPALSSLSAMKDVKISSTVAKGIGSISEAVNKMNVNDLGKISALAHAVATLSAIQSIRISSSIATQIVKLGDAAKSLQGVDLAIFGNLAEALVPLTTLGKANLNSSISALKKMPEVVASLNSLDLDTFSSKVNQLATALRPLASQMNAISSGFAAFPQRIQRVITSTNSLAIANTVAAGSYINLYARLRMAITAVQTIGRTIAQFIYKSNEYVENLNLFNASMGQFASEAQKYAEQVGEIMGIDPSEWMRNQGIFMTLATGFGVASDRAYIMSQNLTQLGYDLSSFFNISYEDAFQKLQSGISGELEPLRRLGYDLSQARLEAIALSLGIDRTFASMTQAEKAQLRYYAIMTQVTTAQGDMARTLNAPANQLRILQAQLSQAARALGSIFIPALNAVLPVAIAVVKVIRILAASIASLFGFSLPEVDYSGIVSDVSAGVGDLSDNLGSAGGNAKKLKNALMGFDEINALPDSSSGGGGGGSGGGIGGSAWDWDLPTYDFIGDAISSQIDAIYQKMEPFLTFVQEHLDVILALAIAVGTELLMWKIAKSLVPDIGSIRKDLSTLLSVVAAMATIVVTAKLVYEFDSEYMKTGKWGYLVADGISTAMGSYISGKAIAIGFKNKKAGVYTAAATLLVSTATTLKAVFDHVEDEGFDTKAISSGIWAAVKGAVAGGMIASAMGASLIGGVLVGGLLTLGVGLVVAIVAASLNATNEAKAVIWGEASLTASEIEEMVSSMFTIDVATVVEITETNVKNLEKSKSDLNEAVIRLEASVNKITLGVEITEGDAETMLAQVNAVVEAFNTFIDEKDKAVEIAVSLVAPLSGTGEDLSADLMGLSGEGSIKLKELMGDLGEDLAYWIQEGMKTGFSNGEPEMIAEISSWMSRISNAATTGKVRGEFEGKSNYLLSDLDRNSFNSALDEYKTLRDETYDTLLENANIEYSEAASTMAMYEEAMNISMERGNFEDAEYYRKRYQEAKEVVEAFDIKKTVDSEFGTMVGEQDQKWIDTVKDVYGSVLTFDNLWNSDAMVGFTADAASGFFENKSLDDTKLYVSNTIASTLQDALNDEDYKVLVNVMETFDLTGWDMLGAEVQVQLFKCFSAAVGEADTLKVFEELGYDLTSVLSAGISSGNYKVVRATNDTVTLVGDTIGEVTLGMTPEIMALFETMGIDITSSLDSGVTEGTPEIEETSRQLGEKLGTAVSRGMADNRLASIHTVKDVGSEVGESYVEGCAESISESELPVMEAPVELIKSGWTTLSTWVSDTNGKGKNKKDTVSQEIGLSLKSGITSVASWLLTNAVLGGSVEKEVDVVKGDWIDLPADSTVTYDIDLEQGWTGKLSEWISSSWRKTFTVDLKKGNGINWRGTIVPYGLNGNAVQIKFAKKGGFPKTGELFFANEDGPEMVGRIGNKTAVANDQQIGDVLLKYMGQSGSNGHIDEERLAKAIVGALKEAGVGSVYLNGKDMADAINAETQRTGRSAIVL